jgi:two-component system sensor histidine kinase AdeS
MDGAINAAGPRTSSALTRSSRRHADHRRHEPTGGPLEQALQRLLAAVAHELRTPLTSIAMTTELLADGLAEGDDLSTAEALARLRRGTLWLRHLVENLSLSTPGDAGQVRLRREPVPVLAALEEVAALAKPLFDRKEQRVRLSCDPRVVVFADPIRLNQIVLNLLSNASKYSFEGDVVDVAVSQGRGRVTISVVDHGPGIEPAERRRVFEPYVRGSATSGVSGLGLGLSIVRALVEAHGGDVRVRETAGGGTTFVVSLPRRRMA